MAEHSKGPWHSWHPWHLSRGFPYAIYDADNVIVAQVPAITQGQANARLIVAAPELEAMVQDLIRAVKCKATGCPRCSGVVEEARALLAKVSAS